MRFFTFTRGALIASLLCFKLNAQTTVTIPLSQGSGADAYLASGTPNSNFGTHTSLGGNTWTCSGSLCVSRGLFMFDLSSIPAGATITNASLQLFADQNWSSTPTTGTGNSGYLMRVTAPWVENAVTWASQPSTTTSNQVIVPASTSSAQDYTLTVTNLVQDMLTNPNYGFMLKMQDEVNYYKALMFASSDNANAATKCPILNISYINTTGITELPGLKAEISIMPNPFCNELSVTSSEKISKIVVTNTMGAVVFEENNIGNSIYKFNKSLPQGIYFISVYSGNENLPVVKKVIRN